MRFLTDVFEKNLEWANSIKESDPDFFLKLSAQQLPEYLWIGCSDSRVPANEIMGMLPGEVFVHRNIANLVIHTDLNALSVIQYAVDVLKVKHIMVVGHYGCGGINAAMDGDDHGLIDNWLRNIQDIHRVHRDRVDAVTDPQQRANLMCELNVVEQVANICATTTVQHAWKRGQELAVHGWVYGLKDGIIKDLDVCVTGLDEMDAPRRAKKLPSDVDQDA